MDSGLRIAIDDEVNVVRHDLHLDNPRVSFAANIGDDNLKVGINASNQHLASILLSQAQGRGIGPFR
jgi:hypothetical protein